MRASRHRRRRVHRLEPRARAARARRRRARARQLLHRQPREPRRPRRRGRRGRAPVVRTGAQRRARRGGRLPSRRARLGAALGAGSLDVERGEHRRNAQRPARGARRRRPPRRLLVELVGVRPAARAAGWRGPAAGPDFPYGVAKLAAERYCVSFSRVYESFESVVVRYFNVFGPRQSPFSQYAAVIPLFVTAISAGEPITVFGDGEQRRDFTYVTNAVDGTIRAAEAPRTRAAGSSTSPRARRRASTTSRRRSARVLGKPVEKDVRAATGRRHPRLLGGHLGGPRGARLGADGRSGRRPAPDRRSPCLTLRR